MELVHAEEIVNYKILPFDLYQEDGDVLFAAGETLTPGKLLQLKNMNFIYKKNMNEKSSKNDSSSNPKDKISDEDMQIFSDNISANKDNSAKKINEITNENVKFSTKPFPESLTPVIEKFDMGSDDRNYNVQSKPSISFDNIDISKYKGPINKFSKINSETQIKIKAFYNKAVKTMSNEVENDGIKMLSVLSDKIVQDIVYELQDIEYCSQIKLLGEFSKCHALNTAIISGFIAKRMGISESSILDVVLAGLLHDIGKIQFPEEFLTKKILTKKEKLLLRRHTVIGYKMIKNKLNLPENIARVALEHHENNDGSGYPASKSADFICRECQIVSVANYFDRVSSNRTHNKVYNIKDAIKVMLQMGSEKFAPEPLYTFAYMFNFNDTIPFEQMLL